MKKLSAFIATGIIAIFTGLTSPALSQSTDTAGNLELLFGSVRTELEQSAMQFAVNYAEELSGKEFFKAGSNSILYFTPQVNMKAGDQDAFNHIIVKVTGNYMLFDTDTVAGVPVVKSGFFHSFPVSAGVESNQGLTFANGLFEAGYMPWYQGAVPRLFKKSKVGLFVQGGYKFKIDSTATPASGGISDQSEETANSELLRIKSHIEFNPSVVLNASNNLGLGLNGLVKNWYDVVNGSFYHQVAVGFKLLLSSRADLNFNYEYGSGAPNFNDGEQFTTNLKIAF